MPLNAGIAAIIPSAGPLANDMKALQIFTKAVIDARPFNHDSTVLDVPWRSVSLEQRRKLRLGLLPEDPLFPLHPPVKDTITKAVQILQSHGHEIVILDPGECYIAAANQVAGSLLSLDNTPGEIIASSGEPVVPSMAMFADQLNSIGWNFVPDLSQMDRLQKFGALQNLRGEIIDSWRKLWVEHNLDAVISPSAQSTAVEHDQYGWPAYSLLLNLLDVSFPQSVAVLRRTLYETNGKEQYPACIIPVGKAKKSEQKFDRKPGQGTPFCKLPLAEVSAMT